MLSLPLFLRHFNPGVYLSWLSRDLRPSCYVAMLALSFSPYLFSSPHRRRKHGRNYTLSIQFFAQCLHQDQSLSPSSHSPECLPEDPGEHSKGPNPTPSYSRGCKARQWWFPQQRKTQTPTTKRFLPPSRASLGSPSPRACQSRHLQCSNQRVRC